MASIVLHCRVNIEALYGIGYPRGTILRPDMDKYFGTCGEGGLRALFCNQKHHVPVRKLRAGAGD